MDEPHAASACIVAHRQTTTQAHPPTHTHVEYTPPIYNSSYEWSDTARNKRGGDVRLWSAAVYDGSAGEHANRMARRHRPLVSTSHSQQLRHEQRQLQAQGDVLGHVRWGQEHTQRQQQNSSRVSGQSPNAHAFLLQVSSHHHKICTPPPRRTDANVMMR